MDQLPSLMGGQILGKRKTQNFARIIRDPNLYPKMWILDAIALDRRIVRLRRHIHSLIHSFIHSQAFVRRHLKILSGTIQQYHDTAIKYIKHHLSTND